MEGWEESIPKSYHQTWPERWLRIRLDPETVRRLREVRNVWEASSETPFTLTEMVQICINLAHEEDCRPSRPPGFYEWFFQAGSQAGGSEPT